MTTLVEALRDPDRKRAIVRDGVALIDREVASKRGLSGAALKTGYAAVRKLMPGFTARALDALMPEFAPAVDPHYARARETADVHRYFTDHAGEIADSMLAVTDARAARAHNPPLQRVYERLRGRARAHVIEAMPGLAQLVVDHVP